jgi:hypothetical protein
MAVSATVNQQTLASRQGTAEVFKAWQCIGCGRIDGPQNCVGICKDRKAEFVYASEHRHALARTEAAEERAKLLESLVRRLASTTPRGSEWERSYLALQKDARRLLGEINGAAGSGIGVAKTPASMRGNTGE